MIIAGNKEAGEFQAAKFRERKLFQIEPMAKASKAAEKVSD
jgi:hypothetical protein